MARFITIYSVRWTFRENSSFKPQGLPSRTWGVEGEQMCLVDWPRCLILWPLLPFAKRYLWDWAFFPLAQKLNMKLMIPSNWFWPLFRLSHFFTSWKSEHLAVRIQHWLPGKRLKLEGKKNVPNTEIQVNQNIFKLDVSENSGTPKSSILIGVFHYKPSIFGYPYFWKHPTACLYNPYMMKYCLPRQFLFSFETYGI